jgi:hypothetical protein
MIQKNWMAIIVLGGCMLLNAYIFRYESIGRCGGDNSCQLVWIIENYVT